MNSLKKGGPTFKLYRDSWGLTFKFWRWSWGVPDLGSQGSKVLRPKILGPKVLDPGVLVPLLHHALKGSFHYSNNDFMKIRQNCLHHAKVLKTAGRICWKKIYARKIFGILAASWLSNEAT